MTDEASYQTLVSTINTSRPALIINPFNMNLDISIYEEDNENSSLHFMTKSIWRSQLTVKISNFDMSPNLSQIALLRELSVYLKDSSRKFRSMIIRPKYNPSSTHSNISEWWKFALISTMIKRRGNSLLYPKNNFTIGFKSEISPSIRSKYIDIYIKYLENKRDNSGYVGLMEEEVKFLDEWSHLLDFGSLLIFRLSAHKRLEEKSIAAAAQTTQKENALWQSLFTVFISPNSTETTPTSVPNTSNADVDFKILYRDVRQSLQELSYFNMYPVDIKIIFSRFALSVDQDDRRCRSLTIICYGLLWNYHQLCFSRDGMILLRLGSIRIFGKEGIQLVSCGDFTDEWFHNYDIQTSPTRLIALSYQHEWYTQNKRSVLYVLPSETVMKPSIAYNNSSKLSHGIKQHQIIEISCSTLRLFWDESSIRHISTMCSDIDTIWIWNFIFPEHSRDNSMKSAILRCSKIERKQLSLDSLPIVKFSVSGTLTGMIIQVPLASNSTRPSDRSQQQRPGRSPYLIEFHVGLCTVYSGDFLMSLDIFRTNNTSITGTSLSSDSIGNSTQFDETSLNYSEGIGNRFYSISSGIWSNRDKIMQNKVRKQIGGASLQHYICTIQNLELKGISSAPSSTTPTPTPSNQTSFTEFPINIQMLLTWCSDWSSLAPNLSIDLLSSAGHFSLEMMVSSSTSTSSSRSHSYFLFSYSYSLNRILYV